MNKEYGKEYSKCFTRTDVASDLFKMTFRKPNQEKRRNYLFHFQHLKNLTSVSDGVIMCSNKNYSLLQLCDKSTEEKSQPCLYADMNNQIRIVELNPL